MSMRIGQGYDVHAFAGVESSPSSGDSSHIVIGGVSIPYKVPLLAHSDGDVLVHALADALLGALALGDIGQHFPDTDSDFRNIDSRQLLRQVMALVAERGYYLVNVDMTIVAQRPKMAEYIQSIAAIEDCIERRLNVFEAGAGDYPHKLARGFLPTITRSVHLYFHDDFHRSVQAYCTQEAAAIRQSLATASISPFIR